MRVSSPKRLSVLVAKKSSRVELRHVFALESHPQQREKVESVPRYKEFLVGNLIKRCSEEEEEGGRL